MHRYWNTRSCNKLEHDHVMIWKRFLCYWPLVKGFRRSPVDSPHLTMPEVAEQKVDLPVIWDIEVTILELNP